MDVKLFLKWAAIFVIFTVGILYVASALLISERISSLFDFNETLQPTIRVEVSRNLETKSHSPSQVEAGNFVEMSEQSATEPKVTIDHPSKFSVSACLANVIRFAVFLALLAIPVSIFYVFLFQPLRSIPTVVPEAIQALDAELITRRTEAAVVISEAMMVAPNCPKDDWNSLRNTMSQPSELVETVKHLLSVRESKARQKAIEIATMAGLTVAASSSALGDGLGMLFWKSKLVYETFSIYGFRPNAKTTLSIWAHVVFASLFATSVEELCELLDVPSILGGIGTRVVQGVVGAASVLRGGHLTRAYLIGGITDESRGNALSDFRSSAKSDLVDVTSSIGNSLGKIGTKAFS